MSSGFIALLDDVAALAKLAAAALDDAAGQAARAGAKAAGVVIDDAAVTPRYVVGLAAERELPIIGRIALGSLRNKLLFLLPAALGLSLLAPWAITPLLAIGGVYLCYEGAEKVWEAVWPHPAEGDHHGPVSTGPDPKALERKLVGGAIKTDFILSAEIMAITLSTVAQATFWVQAAVLAITGVGMTVLVYGVVALIVKADDAGLALAQNRRPASTWFGWRSIPADQPPSVADRRLGRVTKSIGCSLVRWMPRLLTALSVIGTAAMLWVGGGIIIHALEAYGFTTLGHAIHDAAAAVGHRLPAMAAALEWLVSATASGVFGLAVGSALVLAIHHAPRWVLRRSKA